MSGVLLLHRSDSHVGSTGCETALCLAAYFPCTGGGKRERAKERPLTSVQTIRRHRLMGNRGWTGSCWPWHPGENPLGRVRLRPLRRDDPEDLDLRTC